MGLESAIEFTDSLLYEKTGRHLSDLQYCILQQVWGGETYVAIATTVGYSEGHVKDVASQLWRILSDALGERITKGNYRSRLKYWLKRAKRKVMNGVQGSQIAPAPNEIAPNNITQPHTAQPISIPANPNFIGRETALTDLNTLISQGHQIIVIQGEGGLGKTTLAQHYLQQSGFDVTLELLMAKETAYITPVERIVEEWLLQDFNQEPGQDFGINLTRLKRQLKHHRVGILIDNLEPALDHQGQFITPHRQYAELLRVLADLSLNTTTLITSRDRLCEPGIKAYSYRLPCLTLTAWQQFFESHNISAHKFPLAQIHQAYGGNAKAMEIIYGVTQTEYNGNLTTYWQINHTDPLAEIDLKNLIVSQVNRLQQLDPTAYTLFCRLGCYRYQTLARLPAEALTAQLKTLNIKQHHQVIASLRNRSLLETHQGRYWLHPVVRAVAIERLRASHQWQQTNQTAATYWTESIAQIVTLDDGLQAMEAFYHALAIQAFETAADILLKSRLNQWGQFLPLASSLYRMGLLHPVIDAITQVLPQLNPEQHAPRLSELQNILGDAYWITGHLQKAIACQEQTIATTEQLLAKIQTMSNQALNQSTSGPRQTYYFKMLNVDSQLSIGLYKIDLWELHDAKTRLETVIALTQGTQHTAWADKASVALSLTYAHLGHQTEAKTLADQHLHTFTDQQPATQSGRLAYFMQLLAQAYSTLGDDDTAERLYQQAIIFADKSHYVQVKAKALTGLAQLQRQQTRWHSAIIHHTQAIELLSKIGAKCDLAEAHLQFGLTLRSQARGEGAAPLTRLDSSLNTSPIKSASAKLRRQTVRNDQPYTDGVEIYLDNPTEKPANIDRKAPFAFPQRGETSPKGGKSHQERPETHFQKAIQIFTEINAPQQIKKVQQWTSAR